MNRYFSFGRLAKLAVIVVLLTVLAGCALLGQFIPGGQPNPSPAPRVTPPTPTPTLVPTLPSPATPAPTEGPTPTVVPPVLKIWKNGLHGGKLIVSMVKFEDGTRGKAMLYDSTRHYDHPWPDVCDGHEPAWSTWCGMREWDAAKPAIWTAKIGGTGKALRMANVGGQPYAKFIEYVAGKRAVVRTCPNIPDVTEDGIKLKVLGDGCGESLFVPPPDL